MDRTPLRFLFGFVPLAGALACTSGQTGGQVSGPGDAAEDGCVETESAPLDRAEATPLGYSAADVLSKVEGDHEGNLAWGSDPTLAQHVEVTPESGSGWIRWRVHYEGEAIRYIERQPKTFPGGQEPGSTALCPNVLRIPVRLEVETENGAFDDAFTAAFLSSEADTTTLSVTFDPSELQGSFRATAKAASSTVGSFTLHLTRTPESWLGRIDGLLEERQGEVTSGMWLPFGEWTTPIVE